MSYDLATESKLCRHIKDLFYTSFCDMKNLTFLPLETGEILHTKKQYFQFIKEDDADFCEH